MSTGIKVVLSVAAVVMVLVITLAGSYISNFNRAVNLETQIVYAYENNEQILGQYGQKIKEAAQVPSMQKEDLVEIFTAANESRYGEGGSSASFQWLKEQNPTLDQKTYENLQTMIEVGRNDFQNAQERLQDVRRAYEAALRSFWSGTMMRIAGFPTIDLGDYAPISTNRARDTFERGIEEAPLKLR